jgi:hypothetical protein
MYGHPAMMKRWRFFSKKGRQAFFLSRQMNLPLMCANPYPLPDQNAGYLRAFFCLDNHVHLGGHKQ